MQAEDAATDMGGQTKAAVAAAEAVLQESATAVAKQLQRAIPEAHNMFSETDAAPADEDAAQPSLREVEEGSLNMSASDSDAEVRHDPDSSQASCSLAMQQSAIQVAEPEHHAVHIFVDTFGAMGSRPGHPPAECKLHIVFSIICGASLNGSIVHAAYHSRHIHC